MPCRRLLSLARWQSSRASWVNRADLHGCIVEWNCSIALVIDIDGVSLCLHMEWRYRGSVSCRAHVNVSCYAGRLAGLHTTTVLSNASSSTRVQLFLTFTQSSFNSERLYNLGAVRHLPGGISTKAHFLWATCRGQASSDARTGLSLSAELSLPLLFDCR